MRILPFVLTACLLVLLGCDIGDNLALDLDFEILTVDVASVGDNLDPDGYLLSITGISEQRIGVTETRLFSVLRIDITVELRDVAANCAAIENPQTVSVRGPTTVSFVVECS